MKNFYILITAILLLICKQPFAQTTHLLNQIPANNKALKAANPKIHANSNSVFSPGNTSYYKRNEAHKNIAANKEDKDKPKKIRKSFSIKR